MLKAAFFAGALTVCAAPALAATATADFSVTMTITNECVVTSATELAFGSVGTLTVNVDQTSTLNVVCTNGVPYTIGLDVGQHVSSGQRRMEGGGSFINYNLYTNAGRTTAWNDIGGGGLPGATGNGAAQPFTVYGRVPVQTTPVSGSYSDLVTVTVSY